MKQISAIFIILFFLIITVYADTDSYKEYAEYQTENVKFISYSEKWDRTALKNLYNELLQNFHSDEIGYLSNIYIYPDSPYGVNGFYYDDAKIGSTGKYTYGKNAYIKIFNADRYNTVEKIAPLLAHEYGHHYTTYNILKYENLYYSDWKNSQYGKLRELDKYPVCYSETNIEYKYIWDITEIAANDYVQLLGSKNARAAFDYKDITELVQSGDTEQSYFNLSFNIQPQKNMELPLATDVKGLYLYFIKIGGYTSSDKIIESKPKINSVQVALLSELNSKQYKISFDKINDNEKYTYTVVMYPEGNYSTPIPIKTIAYNEPAEAYFGSISHKDDKNKYTKIINNYEGVYDIRIFAQNNKGFLYSSEPYYYDFSKKVSYINNQKFENKPDFENVTVSMDRDFDDVTTDALKYYYDKRENIKSSSKNKEVIWE